LEWMPRRQCIGKLLQRRSKGLHVRIRHINLPCIRVMRRGAFATFRWVVQATSEGARRRVSSPYSSAYLLDDEFSTGLVPRYPQIFSKIALDQAGRAKIAATKMRTYQNEYWPGSGQKSTHMELKELNAESPNPKLRFGNTIRNILEKRGDRMQCHLRSDLTF
jgi:hypothetical protein